MQYIIDWLAARLLVNIALILAYFLFIYYMHNTVVNLSIWVMKGLSLQVYNKVVIWVFASFLLLFVWLLYHQLWLHKRHLWLKVGYLTIVLSFILLHFKYLLEMNIEIIHIYEYPILVLLIFPLTKRFGAAILMTVPFMLMDEWHQYIVLYPSYVDYFEFNDVVLDINGCGLAMITLMICGIQGAYPIKPLWKRSEFVALVASLFLLIVLIKVCFITLYASGKCPNTWLVLNRINEVPTFWRKFPNRDVIYHVMQPLESIFVIPFLLFFYFGLDTFRSTE